MRQRPLYQTILVTSFWLLDSCGFVFSAVDKPVRYSLAIVPIVDTTTNVALDLNRTGQATGWSEATTGPSPRAFFWKGGARLDIELASSYSRGEGINSSGHVTGTFNDGTDRAFFWDGTKPTPLKLWRSEGIGKGINDKDHITGVAFTQDGGAHRAFYLSDMNKDPVDLGYFEPASNSEGRRINNKDQITGVAETKNSPEGAITGVPFFWDGQIGHKIVRIGNSGGAGNCINDKGEVTGSLLDDHNVTKAFLWDGKKVMFLKTIGDATSTGFGINNKREITGSFGANADRRAFFWDGKQMYDLNTLVDNADGWRLVQGNVINDFGQIAGQGSFRGYKLNCVNGHRKDHTKETRWQSTSNSSTSCWRTIRSQKTS